MRPNTRLAVIALVIAFSLALPAAAWADETVTVDGSAGVLQSGGLVEQRADADTPGLTTMSAGGYSDFCQLMKTAAESWDGTQESQSVSVLKLGMTESEGFQAYKRFLNENGQFFYVRDTWSCATRSGVVASVNMLFDTRYTLSSKADFENAANTALAGVQSGWNDEQKALTCTITW